MLGLPGRESSAEPVTPPCQNERGTDVLRTAESDRLRRLIDNYPFDPAQLVRDYVRAGRRLNAAG